jgi:hypothetical protein
LFQKMTGIDDPDQAVSGAKAGAKGYALSPSE